MESLNHAGDLMAARLQLSELQARLQCSRDAALALSLFLGQEQHDTAVRMEDDETELLEEQIAVLSAVVSSYEAQEQAHSMHATEAAQLDASQHFATSLQAQEHWDERVQRAHDRRFAASLALCNEEEWVEKGDLLENPLDLSARPSLPTPPVLPISAPISSHSADPPPPQSSSSAPSEPHVAPGAKGKAPAVAPTRQQQPTHTRGSSSAAHAGSSGSGSGSGSAGETRDCLICFERFPVASMVAAAMPQGTASSSYTHGRCEHLFCSGCMRQYVQGLVQARKYPIVCPSPNCKLEVGHADALGLLRATPKDLQVYELLVTEHSIDSSLRVYCPYRDCSCLLERPDVGEGGAGQDQPFECPSCHRVFCLSCRITGWHAGLTCSQFQALPAALRSSEDAAMLQLAKTLQWKRCPAPECGHIVERIQGCNHMKCRCGCDFCYACGSRYLSTHPTADNAHGTPACTCPLFAVPDDMDDDEEDEQPVQRVVPVVAQRWEDRPYRGGRRVSRTPCRYSESIYDCPMGPNKCWFWHREDEMNYPRRYY